MDDKTKPFDPQARIVELEKDLEKVKKDLSAAVAGMRAVSTRTQAIDLMTMGLMKAVHDLMQGTKFEAEFMEFYKETMKAQFEMTLKSLVSLTPHLEEKGSKVFSSLLKTDVFGDDKMKNLLSKFEIDTSELETLLGEDLKSSDVELVAIDEDSRATLGCDCTYCQAVRHFIGKHDEVSPPTDGGHTKH